MKNHFIKAAFVLAAALHANTGEACSLAQTDDVKIKEKMASAIADHIGTTSDQVDIEDISAPQLLFPLGLGADCSGINAAHHSSGFRVTHSGKSYEGVAVLLGYWYTNPVAVHLHARDASL